MMSVVGELILICSKHRVAIEVKSAPAVIKVLNNNRLTFSAAKSFSLMRGINDKNSSGDLM